MEKIRKAVFRNGIVMLSLLAAIVAGSSVAQAQECIVRVSGSSITARAEGITETVGSIDLQCGTGEGFTPPTTTDISIVLNTQITNKIDADSKFTDTNSSLTFLAVGGAANSTPTLNPSGATGTTGYADGELTEDGNEIEWEDLGLTYTDAGAGVNISGILADATAVGDGGDITARVFVNDVEASGSPLELAGVSTGLKVTVKDKESKAALKGLQCEDSEDVMSIITIQEGFRTAIRMDDEFVVTFTGIPEGVMVLVPDEVAVAKDVVGTTAKEDVESFTLKLKEGTRADGVGDIEDGYGEVELSASGTGEVKYSVSTQSGATANDPMVTSVDGGRYNEWVNLPVKFEWESGDDMPAIGAGSVDVSFNPVSNDDDDIPRYVASNAPVVVVEISDCVTSLLFPFVTNMYGYDTGIALTNTSDTDGSCTVSYSGSDAPADDSEVTVMAGMSMTFGVSMMAPEFQGYVEAMCDFDKVEGFAFISNGFGSMGGPTAAQGYLAVKD